MNRHEGYTVFSPRDIAAYFSEQSREALTALAACVDLGRAADGKLPLGEVTVVRNSSPVITQVQELLEGQIAKEHTDFYAPVTPTHLLRIIECGVYGLDGAYFDDYVTEGTSDADYVHFTPTGTFWNPAVNMVQAMKLAAQFGVSVSALPVPRPISVTINGELESYELPAGTEDDYSTRLNTGVLLAVRRLLAARFNVKFD